MTPSEYKDYYAQSSTRRLWVLVNVCATGFSVPFLTSAVIVAIPTISLEFNTNTVLASWVMAAFQICNMIMLIPASRIADRYGRKQIYLIGIIIFSFSTLLITLSHHILWLLLFRALQGLGAAMFITTGMAIISSVYEGKNRGAAIGWLLSAVYLGMTFGPGLGGWLTETLGWRSIFYCQLPLALFSLALIVWKMPGDLKNDQAMPLDIKGMILFALWILSLYLGVTQLLSLQGWLYLFAAIFIMRLFLQHVERSDNPLIRFKLVWQNKSLSKSLSAALFIYSSYVGMVFILSLYMQKERGIDPSATGEILMYMALVMAIFTPLIGRVSDRFNPRTLSTIGCLIVALGYASLFIQDSNSPLYLIAASLFIVGLGFALFSTPNNHAAMNAVPEERMSMATALLNLYRMLGQTMGLAFATLITEVVYHLSIDSFNEHYLFVSWRSILLLFIAFALTAAFFSRNTKSLENN